MGATLGRPVNKPRLDSVGLTELQKKACLETWLLIEKDITKYSTTVFVRFFDAYPQYRHYFQSVAGIPVIKSVAGVPRTQLAIDARFQSHFRVIFTALGSLVTTAIKRPKLLEGKFYYLAMVHKDMDLTIVDFIRFRDIFLAYIAAQFHTDVDVFVESSWYAFLTAMFLAMCNKMDEIRKEDELEALREEDGNVHRVSGVDKQGAFFWSKYHPHGNPEYWQQRRNFWRTQKELWGEAVPKEEDTVGRDKVSTPGASRLKDDSTSTIRDVASHLKERDNISINSRYKTYFRAPDVVPTNSHDTHAPVENKPNIFKVCLKK